MVAYSLTERRANHRLQMHKNAPLVGNNNLTFNGGGALYIKKNSVTRNKFLGLKNVNKKNNQTAVFRKNYWLYLKKKY